MKQNPWLRRLIQAIVSAALLAAAGRLIDWRETMHAVRAIDASYAAIALLLFVPQTLVSAARWRGIVRPIASITLSSAVRQTLAASALNLVVPGKLGDLSKAAMIGDDGDSNRAVRVAYVAAEKVADVLALLAWSVVGFLALAMVGSAGLVAATFVMVVAWLASTRSGGGYVARVGAWSVALWGLHLLQFGVLFLAAGVTVDWPIVAARIPWAVFSGLIPLTLFGVGLRDSAIVYLFRDCGSAESLWAVGLLTALRYVIPGLAGVPLLPSAFQRREQANPTDGRVNAPVYGRERSTLAIRVGKGGSA